MKVLRWGILGTGNIARQFSAGLVGSNRSVVAAVGSRNPQEMHEFWTPWRQTPGACGDYDTLIHHPDIDAVYISLPNSLHHEWTVKALRAGKHVLCEKPIASNAREAESMFAEAAREGRVLVEGFMYRSHPMMVSAIDAVRRGDIGKVKLIRTSFCYRTTRIEGNIRFDPQLAGGALMDVGCYCVNLSRTIAADEPTRLHATGHLHASGVDDLVVGTMHFPNDIVASFTIGMGVQADNSAYICGDEGFIEIPVPWKPPSTGATYTVARQTPPKMDLAEKKQVLPPPREQRTFDANIELFGLEADDFANTVLDGAAPRVSADDSIGNMRVLDELRRQVGTRG